MTTLETNKNYRQSWYGSKVKSVRGSPDTTDDNQTERILDKAKHREINIQLEPSEVVTVRTH